MVERTLQLKPVTMACGSNSDSTLLPTFLPFYEKALPDVPIYCGPTFLNDSQPTSADTADCNATSYDIAGIFGEAEEMAEPPKTCFHELVESMDLARGYMKSKDDWGNAPQSDDLDKFIDENLAKCRKEADKQKQGLNIIPNYVPDWTLPSENRENLISDEDVVTNESVEGVDDSGCLQPPGVDSTPLEQKPPLTGLDNAPRRPFTHLPRLYQRPRTLFEKKTRNTQNGDWEKCYHIGNEKYLTVSQFRGRKSVHVRQFYMDKNSTRRPTYKGLVLTPDEWSNLTLHVTDVNDILNS